MAQSHRDFKDYSSVQCEPPRDQTEKQPKLPVSAGTPKSPKLSSSSSCSSQSSYVAFEDAFGLPPAPDGGWGWWVVLGSFLISVICDGCSLSFGVLFVHLIEEFNQSKSQTAWVASIFYSLSLLMGPLASALTKRYGCRAVTVVAGLTSCAGFVASSFVTSMWQLYITFGVVVGVSFSGAYVTSVLIVAYYFDKRRSLATGLSVCGSGIGTFVFAPIMEFLIDMYGWRGALQILGAITLNISVCGALFRPVQCTPEQRHQRHLTAFDRLARPVSRLSIPSRNRSRLHSTNSETSGSSSSDSEDDLAALAYSQIELPTYVNADKESIRKYLDKLPELRRSAVDPQLALQRFFKSKDIGRADKSSRGSSPNASSSSDKREGTARAEYAKQSSGSAISLHGDDACVDVSEESNGKRKRKKPHSYSRGSKSDDPNKTLSSRSIQGLTEKLLANSSKPKKSNMTKSDSDRHENQTDIKLQFEEMPDRVLERTQSEKTPGKLQCKMETGAVLERSLSEKLPAKLQCQGGSGVALEYLMGLKANQENQRRVTTGPTTVHSSSVDPGNDMGMLLMNKHSTYLILHRNDIFFRGSRAQRPVPCATSCPELSRLPSSDSDEDSDDDSCLLERCPCLEPLSRIMKDTFDKEIIGHTLFLLLALSNFLLFFWADVPYIFTTDFAISRGIDYPSATFLISIIGIVNTIGQVIYGLIGDQDWNLTVIYGISCIGSGLALVLLPAATTYWMMALLSGIFGFFVSANYSLMTIILVGYLGLEKLAQSYGLIMMIQGLANLGGPPVAGWLVDTYGEYNQAFPLAGGFIMLSGVIVIFLYIMRLCSRFFEYCQVRRQGEHGDSTHGDGIHHHDDHRHVDHRLVDGRPSHSPAVWAKDTCNQSSVELDSWCHQQHIGDASVV